MHNEATSGQGFRGGWDGRTTRGSFKADVSLDLVARRVAEAVEKFREVERILMALNGLAVEASWHGHPGGAR